MIRAVILLGGPSKKASYGAYEQASQLFPIAGLEILSHLVYGICKLKNLKDLVLMGYYDYTHFQQFQESQHKLYGKPIIYVKEKQESGTAGGISKHLDELFHDVDDLLVLHSDICCDFNIQEIYDFHKTKNAETTLVTVKVNKEESIRFGCFIKDSKTDKMVHHAEKPEQYISDLVNCGIYLFNKSIKEAFEKAKIEKENNISEELVQQPCMKFIKKSKDLDKNYLSIENDVLKLIHQVFLFQHQGFWKQIKSIFQYYFYILLIYWWLMHYYQNFILKFRSYMRILLINSMKIKFQFIKVLKQVLLLNWVLMQWLAQDAKLEMEYVLKIQSFKMVQKFKIIHILKIQYYAITQMLGIGVELKDKFPFQLLGLLQTMNCTQKM